MQNCQFENYEVSSQLEQVKLKFSDIDLESKEENSKFERRGGGRCRGLYLRDSRLYDKDENNS